MTDKAIELLHEAYNWHQQNNLEEAYKYCSQALDLNPDLDQGWLLLGAIALYGGQFDTAVVCFRQVLKLKVNSFEAFYNLGYTYSKIGTMPEAEACFRMATCLNPKHADSYSGLGMTKLFTNNQSEAERLFKKAMDLGGDKVKGYTNVSLALFEQNKLLEAEKFGKKAMALNPNDPSTRANLALVLMKQGNIRDGFTLYESRKALDHLKLNQSPFKQPYWHGEDLTGKTILLYSEQGSGDTLQFCRYATMLTGNVIILAPKELKRILKTLSPNITVLGDDDPDSAIPDFDYQCPMMSLPYAYGTRVDTIPTSVYLHADASNILGEDRSKLRVGLVWAGLSRSNDPHAVAIDKRRSIKLAELDELLGLGGIEYVSLQLGIPAKHLYQYPNILDVSEHLKDWYDTAALIQELDLVISVDTAVAHIAGAMGKPVFLLNRHDSCWRWFSGKGGSLWYPSIKCFKQLEAFQWNHPVAMIKYELEKMMQRA